MEKMRFLLLAVLFFAGAIDGLKEQAFVTKDEFAVLQQTLKVNYSAHHFLTNKLSVINKSHFEKYPCQDFGF